jgi:hypothetical protein
MALRKTAAMALIVVMIFVGLFLALSTAGVLGKPRGTGQVSAVNVGVYLDSACTVNCSAITWGNINSGSAITKTVYIKNSGGTALVLKMATSTWNPKVSRSLIALSWNLDNYLLSAGETVPAILTLSAASNTGNLASFNFAIIITGTQQRG